MGKVAQNSVKYVVEAKLDANGLVEKPDIVGAIFGQTEGLLGEDLDLRELQERGKIGRIDVQVEEEDGRAVADIKIPSSLDATETALLGASLETIERVGPTNADISVNQIRDERTSKRDYIVKRAKQLLKDLQEDSPEKGEITDEIKEEVRTTELTDFHGFKAGPEVEGADEIILVEGRADLLNLLRHGVKNAVALGGTDIPENVEEIDDGKKITAFLDGDRGGDLILKELKNKAEPEYVARAPENKEVEELGKEETFKALRDKQPVKYTDTEDVEEDEIDEEEREKFSQHLDQLIGTRAVYILDEELEIETRFPLDNFEKEMKKVDSCYAIAFDGEVNQERVEKAEDKDADHIIGMERTGRANSSEINIVTKEDTRPAPKNA